MLLGFFGGHPMVALPATYLAHSESIDPADSRADFVLQAGGNYGKRINTSGTTQGSFTSGGSWVDNKSSFNPILFEYNITLASGTSPSGTGVHGNTSTWTTFPSSGELNWYHTRTTFGFITCSLDLQIREIADTGNIATSVITVRAQAGV